jgi:hypothetical protein
MDGEIKSAEKENDGADLHDASHPQGCGCEEEEGGATALMEFGTGLLAAIDIVVGCPHCEAISLVYFTQSRGEGMVVSWTDGCQQTLGVEAPDVKAPRVSRCHACGGYFWLSGAKELGAFEPESGLMGEEMQAPDEWKAAPHLQPLTELECYEALKSGIVADMDREMELRIFTWWRGNDPFRVENGGVGQVISEEGIANLTRLLEIMPGGEDDLVLFRAEACRELGKFEEARAELDTICCSDYRFAKHELLGLIEAGDRTVRRLFAQGVPIGLEEEMPEPVTQEARPPDDSEWPSEDQ